MPRSTRPDPGWSGITVGWLLDAGAAGKLPDLDDASVLNDPTFRLRFGLTAIDADRTATATARRFASRWISRSKRGTNSVCTSVRGANRSDGWYFQQQYTVQLLEDGRPVGSRLGIHPNYGHLLRAQLDDLHVRFGLAQGTEAFILCR